MQYSLGPQRSSIEPLFANQHRGPNFARLAKNSFQKRLAQRPNSAVARGRRSATIGGVAAVQRSESPSRFHRGPLSVPAAAPATNQHPDAVKRREQAEERKRKRQQFTEATATGVGWWEFDNPTNMHMVTSPDEFQDRIKLAKRTNSLVVADYFAPWCHACKALHPKLQQLASSNPEVTFLSVNAGNHALNKLCEEVGVTQLPYFHFLKGDAGLVAGFSANLTAQKLQQIRAQIMLHK